MSFLLSFFTVIAAVLSTTFFVYLVLGEGDLIYTQTLCRIGHEDFSGKTVLVLGGGDGGILHELLKEDPKFITVAEIGMVLLYIV